MSLKIADLLLSTCILSFLDKIVILSLYFYFEKIVQLHATLLEMEQEEQKRIWEMLLLEKNVSQW